MYRSLGVKKQETRHLYKQFQLQRNCVVPVGEPWGSTQPQAQSGGNMCKEAK